MRSRILWKFFTTVLFLIGLTLLVLSLYKSVFVSSLIALGVVAVIGFFLSKYLTQPLQNMASATRMIAQGDFSHRLTPASHDELGVLAESINLMAMNLQKQFLELETEKKQLQTILDGMVEGVMVTDDAGVIVLTNPSLNSLLGSSKNPVGKTVLEFCRNRFVHDLVQSVLGHSTAVEMEITLQTEGEEQHLLAHGAPLATSQGFRGTVSVFYDATRMRRLESVRKEFVANVSHELKTPLTNIIGYAETLSQGALSDPEAAHRFIVKIQNNAMQLKNLVEDILKLSEIESGRLEMQKTPVILYDSVTSLQNFFEEALKNKRLIFQNSVPKTVMVYADLLALRQILINLIDNAIKYTPDGGEITVSSEQTETSTRISVRDTGIGIPETDVPHVFERFYRVDKARSREMGGTGLGLAIVKHLVQAHGGEVGVESKESQGSRFWFTVG